MAYKINGTLKGFYTLFTLELEWTKLKEMNKTINLMPNIWRYMFVKLEK
jgi:ribosomal protein S6